ncbi:MAG: limonene,2-epoxide hydrolase [Mycobacterium sp.]|jgi:limonene-1,2-epoxide hydrolase|nr:limonene,2-epoxide hydrolase [Mycobacterium sp.]
MDDRQVVNGLVPDVAPVVESFLHAVLRDKDFDTVEALLADDVVYENVGYPTLRGGQRIVTTFRRMAAKMPWLCWDVRIHRIVTDGTSVLTERTDAIIIGPFQAHFWVCGVFEVRDGRITLWRDYFDLFDMFKGSVRGVAAIAIPTLRRTL